MEGGDLYLEVYFINLISFVYGLWERGEEGERRGLMILKTGPTKLSPSSRPPLPTARIKRKDER